ncbi:MAG TPA: hypothetical protein VG389_28790, partial [Myxococcota bacterium]|nr:hypothetical protein [Myxococcota bacterium]
DGLLAFAGYLMWADVVETAEQDARPVPVEHGPGRIVPLTLGGGGGSGAGAASPVIDGLATPLRAGDAVLSRHVAPLPDRPGTVLWYEHQGGSRLVLRARVLLASRPCGALAFANEGARLRPAPRDDGGLRFRLHPGTPSVTFHCAGAVFVERPAWRGVRYAPAPRAGIAAGREGQGGGREPGARAGPGVAAAAAGLWTPEEDLPSPGFFFTILRRPGAVARIAAVADDGPAPALVSSPPEASP